MLDSVFSLFIEADAAAVAESDLAGELVRNCCEVCGGTVAVHVNKLVVTADGGDRFVRVGSFGVEYVGTVHRQIRTGEADVVCGSDCEGVVIGSGRTVHLHGNVFRVQITDRGSIFCPVAAVARGHGNDRTGILEVVHDLGIHLGRALGEAGVAGAERQVDGVTAEEHSVFDSRHVVGVVGTAALTEHTHREDLCIRCSTLYLHGIESGNKAALAVRNVRVCSSDTGNVCAVFIALDVLYVKVLVDVVEIVGFLFVAVEIRRGQPRVLIRRVELIENGGDLVHVEEIERVNIVAALTQRVEEGVVVEALVVGIDTGIDDRNTGACAGVAFRVCAERAGHNTGGSGIGIRLILGFNNHRFVTGFQNDFLDARNFFDCSYVAVGYVCGDEVGSEGEVPDNVQIVPAENFTGDLLCHGLLLFGKSCAVLDRLFVLRNVFRGEFSGRGSVLQDDGDTHHFICRRLFVCGFIGDLVAQCHGNRVIVNLLHDELGLFGFGGIRGVCGTHRRNHAKSHHSSEEPGQNTLCELLLHGIVLS